jgi:acyl-CoA synthetase (AMP-forming)/AMP-acid ligase II
MRTVVMVPPSLEFFALTFALFKVGAVPVLIDPGMGVKNLGRCIAEAAPAAFLGIRKALLGRRILRWGRKTIRIAGSPSSLADFSDARDARTTEAYPIAHTRPDETAAILFTSGSTGPPKGAVYTHAVFAAQVDILRNLYGIAPGEIDLCTFPLFALYAPALGMTAIIPEMDATRPARVNPARIFEAIEAFGVTNLFGSPALIRRVGEAGAKRGVRLPTLRRVISAGAPVPASVLETFATLLAPGVQLFTPYGATEALPVASIGSAEVLGTTRHETDRGAGVCVGRPVGGIRVKIIQISDEPIAEWSDALIVPFGQIGEIVVQGPVVTRGYVHRPDATALAKIADPGAGQGGLWHRMGDLGYHDALGRIWFCGRKSQRVVTAEGTLFTIPCEAVFNTNPAVARTALVGVGPPGQMRPVLCVEPRKWPLPRSERDRLRSELLELGAIRPHTRLIKDVLFHRSFPVDIRHNAKIFRERLAVWAARRVSS